MCAYPQALATSETHRFMINKGRLTAKFDEKFVVFLIGMRVNQPLKVHKWWPVATAMPRMIKELSRRPELGFLHAEMWFGRTTLMVQYWRSVEHLLHYAKDREAEHLPAWRAFNQRGRGTDAAVGIWHETYLVSPGTYENIYVDMPPFGLGKVGALEPATKGRQSAADRLRGS